MRGLYAIIDTDYITRTELKSRCQTLLAAGCKIVQYRNKKDSRAECLADARLLQTLCETQQAEFIVNDHLDIATELKCGVHLGDHDAGISAARAQLGEYAIVGASCYNSLERAQTAIAAGASYIAFGAFFSSQTKPGAVVAEPATLQQACALNHPIVAIGGITPDNGGQLVEAGADMLAVISSLWKAPDLNAQVKRFQNLF